MTRYRFVRQDFDHGQTWIDEETVYTADNRLTALLIWLTLRKAPGRWVMRRERAW